MAKLMAVIALIVSLFQVDPLTETSVGDSKHPRLYEPVANVTDIKQPRLYVRRRIPWDRRFPA